MNKQTDKFIQELQSIKLEESSKVLMREKLSEYADFKPIKKTPTKRVSTSSPPFFLRPTVAVVLSVFLMFSVTSTGVVFAAKDSMPGDILYSVKTKVHEPLRQLLAITPEQTARVALLIAEERLTEIFTLRTENRLSPETQQELIVAYNNQIQTAQSAVTTIASHDTTTADTVTIAISSQQERYAALFTETESPVPRPYRDDTPTTNLQEEPVPNVIRPAAITEADDTDELKYPASVSVEQRKPIRQEEADIHVDIQKQIDEVKEIVTNLATRLSETLPTNEDGSIAVDSATTTSTDTIATSTAATTTKIRRKSSGDSSTRAKTDNTPPSDTSASEPTVILR